MLAADSRAQATTRCRRRDAGSVGSQCLYHDAAWNWNPHHARCGRRLGVKRIAAHRPDSYQRRHSSIQRRKMSALSARQQCHPRVESLSMKPNASPPAIRHPATLSIRQRVLSLSSSLRFSTGAPHGRSSLRQFKHSKEPTSHSVRVSALSRRAPDDLDRFGSHRLP